MIPWRHYITLIIQHKNLWSVNRLWLPWLLLTPLNIKNISKLRTSTSRFCLLCRISVGSWFFARLFLNRILLFFILLLLFSGSGQRLCLLYRYRFSYLKCSRCILATLILLINYLSLSIGILGLLWLAGHQRLWWRYRLRLLLAYFCGGYFRSKLFVVTRFS